MSFERLIVEADGASRGNPGDAAGGAVVIDPESGNVLATAGVLCGHASNNVAEYRGMIAGIEMAQDISPDAVIQVKLDSKLVVEQMSGRWKIKHPDMKDLAATAREVIGGSRVTFEWVPREENARADAAANAALDRKASYRLPYPAAAIPPILKDVRKGRPGNRVTASAVPRNVRAPQSRMVGNTHPE